jgi:hypothetical protein
MVSLLAELKVNDRVIPIFIRGIDIDAREEETTEITIRARFYGRKSVEDLGAVIAAASYKD